MELPSVVREEMVADRKRTETIQQLRRQDREVAQRRLSKILQQIKPTVSDNGK